MKKTKQETKTNNFDELPKAQEIWIQIGEYRFITTYKNHTWQEAVQKDEDVVIFHKVEEVDESDYLNHAIGCYEVYLRKEKRVDIDFAGRIISLEYSEGRLKDHVTVQIAKEEYEESIKEHVVPVDVVQFNKEKWFEIAEFFKKSSVMFLNDLPFFEDD